MNARASVNDPLKVFRYRVEIDGFARAGFSECSGLSRTTSVAEYREGGMNDTVQKSAGLTTFGDITMKRGQIIGSDRGGDADFIEWCQQVFDVSVAGNAANYRRTFDVVQYNAMNQEVARWTVNNAFPAGFKAHGDLSGTSSDNSVEELTIAHEGF